MDFHTKQHETAFQTAVALCLAWFRDKDAERCRELLSDEVMCIGVTMPSHTRGKQETLCMIQEFILYHHMTLTVEIVSYNLESLSDDTVQVELDAVLRSDSGSSASLCVSITVQNGLVRLIHIIPIMETYLPFHDKNYSAAERELSLYSLHKHMPGGICKYYCKGNEIVPIFINSRFNELIGIDKSADLHGQQGLNYSNVHPDDLSGLRAAILETITKTHTLNHTYRTRKANSDTYIWLNMQGNAVEYTPEHTILYACYTDVTEHQKLLLEHQKRFAEAERYHNQILIQDLILSGLSNITTNEMLNVRANLWEPSCDLHTLTQDALLSAFADTIIDPKDRLDFLRIFDAKQYSASAENETERIKRDYQIILPAETTTRYARIRADIAIDKETDDILVMFSIKDVSYEVITKLAMDHVVSDNFDYVCLVDMMHNTSRMLYCDDSVTHFRHNSVQFSVDFNRVIHETVAPHDLDRALEMMSSTAIAFALQTQKFYTVVLDLIENGEIYTKQIRFRYLDKAAKTVLLMRSDITDALIQEQKQRSALETALLAAQQASVAKSDFLSRMSHEIRTPLNAIIGMTALAQRTLDDKAETANCISQISSSSRYLLSLINNILDMSRIESGSVLLKPEKFNFQDFLSNVTALIRSQATVAEVTFKTVLDPLLREYYIGDALRLQQALTNILSNAVKFTPSGGTVTLTISVKESGQESDSLRFVVSDTGIGMSEAFLAHIFEPFAQENDSTTGLEGTGLGLSITKNMVDLMGGLIDVESHKGTGTTFTVDLPFGLCGNEQQPVPKHLSLQNLSERTALVVDDDVSICEALVQMISEIGIHAEWTTSGQDAIQRAQTLQDSGKCYDLILINWKMPAPDGIETTRRIRAIGAVQTAIILTTAYDCSIIEEEARRAGADLVIAKPVFRSALITAIDEVLSRERKQGAPKINYDFRDKRILLTEDNPTNIEVAKRLLSWRGFLVDVAENGQIAVERFVGSAPDTYCAILMDIRMPVMDGLTAAREIRASNHPNAANIPIIAMTANAFEEDKEKSRKAGMNYHLAKPIDPTKLYDALGSFIFPANPSG